MLGLIEWLIALAWKVLATVFVVSVFVALLKNGKQTISKVIELFAKIITVVTESLTDWLTKKHMEHVRTRQERES